MNKAIAKVECRIKVMGYPIETIKEAYESLIDEGQRSEEDLMQIMRLRGVNQNDFKNMLGNFIKTL